MAFQEAAIRVDVRWRESLQFQAHLKNGRSLNLDGDDRQGASPMEALLCSLCGCMATDVVLILQTMRVDLQGLEVLAGGHREAEPPRFFNAIELEFKISGTVPRARVDRAIQLSFDKYCSVFHTLRPDLKLSWAVSENAPRSETGTL